MSTGRDLREFQNSDAVLDAFSALVSGKKYGYKTVIEKKKEIIKCSGCQLTLSGNEKFCPECGTKVGQVQTQTQGSQAENKPL